MSRIAAGTARKSFDANGLQFGWDATSIELAQTCPRKYYYSMIEGWSPRTASVHLIFGGHYAHALETFFKLRAQGSDYDEAMIAVVGQTLLRTWDNEANEPQQFDHSSKTRFTLIRSIVWYLEEFRDDNMPVYHLADGTPAVELSFAIEITDEIILSGHLDKVVQHEDSLFVMDQKTTGSTITPKFFADFSPNNQMSLYSFAGQAILSSPVRGVIVDAAQIAAGFTRFERGFVRRTPDQLSEWFAGTLHTIEQTRQQTARALEGEGPAAFPMTLASCGNYGGCPFRSVCSRSPAVRPNMLAADFTQQSMWDPLSSR